MARQEITGGAGVVWSTIKTMLNNMLTELYQLFIGKSGGQTIIGGTDATDALKLQGTAGTGTATSPAVQVLTGTAGGTTAVTVLNNGNVGVGVADPDASLEVAGLIKATATYTSGYQHSYEDKAELTNIGGYSSFDTTATLTNTVDAAHLVGYQSRLNFAGSADLTSYTIGYFSSLIHSGSGNIVSTYGSYITDPTKTGSGGITNNYGMLIAPMTAGTKNYGLYVSPFALTTDSHAIYSAGGRATFMGLVGVGGSHDTSKLYVVDTALAGSGSLAGGAVNIAQTWNTTGAPTAFNVRVNPTAYGTGALLMNLTSYAASKFAVTIGGNVGVGTSTPTSKMHVVGIPVYADNAAAIAGGLTAGAFYRTGADPDPLMIVH